MHVGALPHGRANAPMFSNTLLRHYPDLSLNGSAIEPQRTQRISQRNAKETFLRDLYGKLCHLCGLIGLKIAHLEF
jgi:hypothetical protein